MANVGFAKRYVVYLRIRFLSFKKPCAKDCIVILFANGYIMQPLKKRLHGDFFCKRLLYNVVACCYTQTCILIVATKDCIMISFAQDDAMQRLA